MRIRLATSDLSGKVGDLAAAGLGPTEENAGVVEVCTVSVADLGSATAPSVLTAEDLVKFLTEARDLDGLERGRRCGREALDHRPARDGSRRGGCGEGFL